MSKDLRKIAAENAAKSIVVGILWDQVKLMRQGNVLIGKGQAQALKVERWCEAIIGPMPRIKSAAGMKNLQAVCDVCQAQFATHWPHLASTSAMAACAAIFTSHYVLGELRRALKLNTAPWRYLDQTTTTLLALMLGDIPEEEERMFAAAVPVFERIMEIAA